ncbi:ERV/ALR sulfhydryl oxidase domain-containing protein [Pilobolus umbonatus]|nr:ERV/ALR sulfhydryl oxidase domain-containing protein [Pilobolus umbonatus]
MTESVYVDPETGEKIPMKDGKPCRVCVDIKTWKRLGKKKSGNTETAAGAPTTASVKEEVECPADVKTLGRHTWTLLHTMAAYYPEQPTPDQQNTMKQFIHSFAEVYPCWFCKVKNII